MSVVEKKKTGEYYAAKVVSGAVYQFSLGESSQDAETYHALLGVQANSQDARKDVRALPALCWRREDR